MSISFSSNDLLNIAIDIEKRGIAFYDIMAKSTENVASREVFQYLAAMERGHVQIFEAMQQKLGEYEPPKTQDKEYGAYLKALVDSAVFTDEFVTSEMAEHVVNDIEAIELAISAEKDSILFYYEMKDIMPRQAQPTVDKIITEEKSHLRQLSELKGKLAVD